MRNIRRDEKRFALAHNMIDNVIAFADSHFDVAFELIEILLRIDEMKIVPRIRPLDNHDEKIAPYIEQRYAAGYPAGTPPGWWNDEGASGPPKIVVRIGEQKAYFYKGKHVVGETTVSTGKPGFSTPAGHYRIVSKDRDHVSSEFGDYVEDYGDVLRWNIDE